MKANNGGPAFPSQYTITEGSFNPHTGTVAKCNQVYIELGASLRDYFAAQALQGLMSNNPAMEVLRGCTDDARNIAAVCSEACYAMADAMLAERAANSLAELIRARGNQ